MEYTLIKKDNSTLSDVTLVVRSFLMYPELAEIIVIKPTRLPSSFHRCVNYGKVFLRQRSERQKIGGRGNIGEQRTRMDQFLVHRFIILAAKRKVRLVTQAQQAFGPHRRDCRDSCCSL